ncbi:hypothetical protein [Methylocucumis oryzae]|uniref:hypothetical protein n=1 Tax=Methylocucumis oryzae TaxID=1632867 RepID=UPI001EF9CC5A|nr:hypothetical protein [Methylocucumis oryzae]
MNALLISCQLLPLVGILLITLFGSDEHKIARLSFWVTHAMGLAIACLLGIWAWQGFPAYEFEWFTLYEHGNYRLPVLFYLDKIGATLFICDLGGVFRDSALLPTLFA